MSFGLAKATFPIQKLLMRITSTSTILPRMVLFSLIFTRAPAALSQNLLSLLAWRSQLVLPASIRYKATAFESVPLSNTSYEVCHSTS